MSHFIVVHEQQTSTKKLIITLESHDSDRQISDPKLPSSPQIPMIAAKMTVA